MILYVLIGVLVLAVAGCASVIWAARGGPRWVRAIATVTLLGGEAVRAGQRRSAKRGGGDDASALGSD
ncbi:hypothetical protein ABZ926_15395 [Streptomyces litmocidini]|uniref:Uncharacterized protein n=1 Tax=Streptomyces litmocidini TaxID=67318 RepID=A0ABW7UK63_9ACTN|nr:hypothetical protein [Streptomyces sp. PanSC19]ROQ34679.1 hypothetical protein EDD98_3727 [Streptomyces sp. PanSC19]